MFGSQHYSCGVRVAINFIAVALSPHWDAGAECALVCKDPTGVMLATAINPKVCPCASHVDSM